MFHFFISPFSPITVYSLLLSLPLPDMISVYRLLPTTVKVMTVHHLRLPTLGLSQDSHLSAVCKIILLVFDYLVGVGSGLCAYSCPPLCRSCFLWQRVTTDEGNCGVAEDSPKCSCSTSTSIVSKANLSFTLRSKVILKFSLYKRPLFHK